MIDPADQVPVPTVQPSARPWRYRLGRFFTSKNWPIMDMIFSGMLNQLSEEEQIANAEYALRAINAHDDLLTVAKTILLRLDLEAQELGERTPFICNALRPDLRAAIAKAEGGVK